MAVPESTMTLVTKTYNSIAVDITPPPSYPAYAYTRVTWVDVATGTTGYQDIIGTGTVTLTGLRSRAYHMVMAQTVNTSGDASIITNNSALLTITQFESDTILQSSVEIDTVSVQPNGLVKIEYRCIAIDNASGDLVGARYDPSGGGFLRMTPAETDPAHSGIDGLAFSIAPGTSHVYMWNALADLGEDFFGTVDVSLVFWINGIETAPAYFNSLSVDFREVEYPQAFIAPGDTLTLTFTAFHNGVPADFDVVQVTEVRDPTGAVVAGGPYAATPQTGTGNYSVDIPIAGGATLGQYVAQIDTNTPAVAPFTQQAQLNKAFFVVAASTYGQICTRDDDTVILYGQVYGLDKQPLASKTVVFEYVTDTEHLSRVGSDNVVIETDTLGHFCAALMRKATIRMSIPCYEIHRRIILPDAPYADFIAYGDTQPSIVARDAFGHPIP